METKFDEILKSVGELKVINRLSKNVDKLFENVSILTKANQDLNLKFANLEVKVLAMGQIMSEEKNTPPEQKLIDELLDRQSRSNNVILFNLTEEDNKDDSQKIKNVISSLNEKIEKFTFFRLGKPKSDIPEKSRPVMILLSNQSDVFTILRSQTNMKSSTSWSNIRFSSDRITKEREEMANLSKTLQQRKENGEQDVIIKYIKGIPRTVKTTKN
ncbi:Hypothetical protein CINCED_3A019215 [Cinara cedri]|uniref:Uncharacterized protein n=1 Tax=Cinara cedri TaxID=506608 RepID=A0A5E4NM42_9HEMI|nr:Hypothetical protein CINCED_3A019215 [Cinara cedri]